MHEELLPEVEKLEQAVAAADAAAAAAVLGRLADTTIYSGNDVYERMRALENALYLVLFDGLDPRAFGSLVESNRHLSVYDAWGALESEAGRISAGTLWTLADHLGLPFASRHPRLHATLAAAADPAISEQLVEWIDRMAESQAADGISFSEHEQFVRGFRFVRWTPDDRGLAERVRLLAERSDEPALAACRRYLFELPWGADREATGALLEGLGLRGRTDWLHEALAKHRDPVVLRCWLWKAIAIADPVEGASGLLHELASANDERNRIFVIEELAGLLMTDERLEGSTTLKTGAEAIDTTRWSAITRGYFGSVLAVALPQADASRVSSRYDRGLVGLARAWEAVRFDHMGCLMPLLAIPAMVLFSFGLDFLFGRAERLGWLPPTLAVLWFAWAMATMRTHFSGRESIRQKVVMAGAYFGLLLAWLVAAVWVRLP